MKKYYFLLILCLFINMLNADNFIEFDLVFNLEEIISNDKLINFQLFDSDNDGVDEVFAGFKVNLPDSLDGFRLVQYTSEGNYISSIYQSDLIYDKANAYKIVNYDNTNLLIILYENHQDYTSNTYWIIRIYYLDTFQEICEFSLETPYDFVNFKDFEVLELDNQLQLLLGLCTDYTSSYNSYIERFTFQDSLVHRETIWDCGYRIINQSDTLFTIGYNCEIDFMPMDYSEITIEYLFSRLTINDSLTSELELLYAMDGYHYTDDWTTIYDNLPYDFSFLSNNELDSEEYGCLISEVTKDDENGLQIKFTCVDYLNNEIIWEQSYPCFPDMGYHGLKASTVIEYEDTSKFVILFWRYDSYPYNGYHRYLILNRENGNVIIVGYVPFYCCWSNLNNRSFVINRLSNDELLFFTGDGNLTGYDIYKINEFQVDIESYNVSLSDFSLSNFPNPFNSSTVIYFTIPKSCEVDINIYNIKGQEVKTLMDDYLQKGDHFVVWNRADDLEKQVTSGLYFIKLDIDGEREFIRKCLILK